jgi:3'-phosphoadenosine 5'-phosphosulfate sulfotransferase (PAPS reductase)/FAD synthetase
MLRWVVAVGMKKKHALKNVFSLTGMNLDSGILKTKGLKLWSLYQRKKNMGEHFRVFPISNWTEMDVWQYVTFRKYQICLALYFTHQRKVFKGTEFGWPTPHL